MGSETAVIAYIGLALSAASAYQQHEAAQDQADAIRKQSRTQIDQTALEQKKADLENARQARVAVRQARIARAAVINQGANTGTLGSSGVVGGASSVGAQLGGNLDFFNETAGLNSQIFGKQVERGQAVIQAADAQADSAKYGAIGALGGTVFSGAGGFKTIFS